MELQFSVEEICNAAFFWGESESFLSVTLPRTPNRCCSGSTRTSRSYFVNVKDSRSRADTYSEVQTRKRIAKNFISGSMLPSLAFAARSHKGPRQRQLKRSGIELCRAWEWIQENHISCRRDHALLCLRSPIRSRNPCCNRRRHSSAFRVRRGLQSTVLSL